MKLITELSENISPLVESKGDNKNLYIEGIFMQSEIKNRNGRIYPRSVMEFAVNKYIFDKVNQGQSWGELSHPESPKINPDRVSHLVTELKFNGNDVYGKAKIGGPKGDAVKSLLELGGKVAVSSRGLGSLRENKSGIMEVQNDFQLATAADIVLDPSAPSAFVKGIMEGVDWYYKPENDSWEAEKIRKLEKHVKSLSKRELLEKKYKLFEHYVNTFLK